MAEPSFPMFFSAMCQGDVMQMRGAMVWATLLLEQVVLLCDRL
jgi:hypothetical protein